MVALRLATTLAAMALPSSRFQSRHRTVRLFATSMRRGNRDKFRRRDKGMGRSKTKSNTEPLPSVLPSITQPGGPKPTFFSCRHTYEDALVEEILRLSPSEKLEVSSPCDGLVQLAATNPTPGTTASVLDLDPVYALQALPDCSVIQATSIKQLAVRALKTLGIDDTDSKSEIHNILRDAPKGSLAVHFLVPGMFKGQRDPVLIRRGQMVAAEAIGMLEKPYPCARSVRGRNGLATRPQWLLQFILFSPEVMGTSLSQCKPTRISGSSWPTPYYPAGLANADIEDEMPSSAYRKLIEGLACMGCLPPRSEHPADQVPAVVDLGACPGGWTAALRIFGCKVIAVDRSELRKDLMIDDMVEFVKGDAFSYIPPRVDEHQSINNPEPRQHHWMVSDVIAYPERVSELLERWCGGKWAAHMIVTAKFQGEAIPWDALESARNVAVRHGYECRVKHFFNNKNEVTLMISHPGSSEANTSEESLHRPFVCRPMYPVTLGVAPTR